MYKGLLALLSTWSICVYRFIGSVSNVTPSNLSWLLGSTIARGACGTFGLPLFTNISHGLLRLSVMWFFSAHFIIELNSGSAMLLSSLRTGMLIAISSAYLTNKLEERTSFISFIIKENNTGPCSIPWRTPLVISRYSEVMLSTRTRSFLLIMKLISQFEIYVLISTSLSLPTKIMCDTESNAFLKSIEEIPQSPYFHQATLANCAGTSVMPWWSYVPFDRQTGLC